MVGAELAREYVAKFTGKLNKAAIGRKLHEDFPEVFKSSDQARHVVRRVTGAAGEFHRIKGKKQSVAEYNFPEPDTDNTAPYKLPKNITDLGVISDLHIPYHDKVAVKAAVKYFKEAKVQALLLNGDIMDIYMWSRHQKDKRKRDMGQEVKDTRAFLFWLRNELPDAIMYWKWGNHDERWSRFLGECDPALLDIDDFQLSTVLRFGELKIIDTATKGPTLAGKLPIFHGHELGMTSGGVNPSRSIALKTNSHGMTSHFHKSSLHTEPHYGGSSRVTYSIGCLCQLFPEYMMINKWNHGFAHLDIRPNGDFSVKNFRIVNGNLYE